MLMTQLDHGTALSPSTPQYKPDLDPNKPITPPPPEQLNFPLPDTDRKQRKRESVCLTKLLFSSLQSCFLCSLPSFVMVGQLT